MLRDHNREMLQHVSIFSRHLPVVLVAGALLATTMSALAQDPAVVPPAATVPAVTAPAVNPPTSPAGIAIDGPRRVVVRFLTEGDFPPFNYYDDEGVLTGLNIDLARAICLELQAACDIKVRPWDELFVGLKRAEADAVIAGHALTAQSLKLVDFSDRYFFTPGRFVMRTGSTIEPSPEAFDGKVIGVAKGSAHEAFLRAFFRDSRLQGFETSEQAREALQLEKVDAVFDDAVSLAFWLNGALSRKCCEFKGGPYFEPKYFGDGIAIAVPKSDLQIRMLLNAALERVRVSGRFQEIVDRYFPIRVY
jgi:polar amino acid transport system substrate-binding protein